MFPSSQVLLRCFSENLKFFFTMFVHKENLSESAQNLVVHGRFAFLSKSKDDLIEHLAISDSHGCFLLSHLLLFCVH